MKIAAALLAVLLAGCAHERVVIKPVEVKVPVMVACAAELPPEPEKFTDRPLRGETQWDRLFEAVQLALAEIEGWRGWALQAKAAVRGCQLKGGTKP